MNERRTESRTPFVGQAYLTYNGRCRCEDVVDVSPNGLQLRSAAWLKPGRQVKVFLPLERAGKWRMCLLKGEVVRRDGPRGDRRVGVAFTPDELDTRDLLADFCAA